MAREKAVIDASVVLKWFLHESGREEALEIGQKHRLGQVQLVVPDLLFVEVLNVLRYKGASSQELKDINRTLWNLQFRVERVNSLLLEKATCLALQYNLSIYDSLYLAVSIFHGISLITADKALAKAPSTTLLTSIKR